MGGYLVRVLGDDLLWVIIWTYASTPSAHHSGLDDIPHLSIDQKWHIVYNDEQMRWADERRREEQSRKQNESGQAAAFSEGTPEWYIRRFMDRTITPKQAASLLVSLRTGTVRLVFLCPCFLTSTHRFFYTAGLNSFLPYKAHPSLPIL